MSKWNIKLSQTLKMTQAQVIKESQTIEEPNPNSGGEPDPNSLGEGLPYKKDLKALNLQVFKLKHLWINAPKSTVALA